MKTRVAVGTASMAFILFLNVSLSISQERSVGNGNLGIGFMMVFPKGDFAKNVDDLGFGLTIDLGYTFWNLPLTAAAEKAKDVLVGDDYLGWQVRLGVRSSSEDSYFD